MRMPLAAVVGAEFLVAAWFVAAGGPQPPRLAVAGSIAVTGLLLLVTAGGTSPAAMAARQVAFLGRGTVATARPDPEATAPPALRAIFPGLVLRRAHDRRGRPFAVAEWAGTATVILSVRPPDGPLVHARTVTQLPLAAIHDAVTASGVPVEAVTVTCVLPGSWRPAPGDPPGTGQKVAQRTDLVSLRVRPFAAHSAITIRGGGRTGLDATLAALAALVRVTVAEAGLTGEALDVPAASAALLTALEPGHDHPADGSEATWAEAWAEISGPGTVQTSAAVTSWDPAGSPAPAPAGQVPDRVLTAGLVPSREGPAVVRIVLRAVAAPGTSGREMRRAAAEATRGKGLRSRAAVGEQLAALRASTPLGPGVRLPDPRDAPGSSLLQQGLAIDPRLLDRLTSPLSRGVPFGTADTGETLEIDLVGARPLRIVAVGQGWLAGEIAARAADAHLPVVVVTDRPAPWFAMARSAAVSDRVTVVADERSVDHAPAGGSGLVVVDGAGSRPTGAGQGRWRTTVFTTLRAEAVPPEVTAAADLILIAPDAGDDPQRLATALHLDSGVGARAVRLTGMDVLAISRGSVITARLQPVSTLTP
jgi:hypothetical protein